MSPERLQRHRDAAQDLWKQVGLEELRKALKDVEILTRHFEKLLRMLPPCSTCARVNLLQQVHAVGSRLGSEIISLTVLASILKQVMAVAEQAQGELVADAPAPCQCSTGPCTCHD